MLSGTDAPLSLDTPGWFDRAACRGRPHLFFPDAGEASTMRRRCAEARALCSGCPVLVECMTLADRTRDRYAFYAGETAQQRMKRWGAGGALVPPGDVDVADRRRRVVELRAEGLLFREIAGKLGISKTCAMNDYLAATEAA